MHLDVSGFVLGDDLVDCPTLPWVHIRVEGFSGFILFPYVLEPIFPESEGDVGLADSIVDVDACHVIVSHVFLVDDRLVEFGSFLGLV